MVIEDNTVEADKDWRETDKACPVLLYASCGGNNKRTNMAKHNEEYKPIVSCSRITEERTWNHSFNQNIDGDVSAKLAGIGKK